MPHAHPATSAPMTAPPAPPETAAPAQSWAPAPAASLGTILLDRRQREPDRPLLLLEPGLALSPRVAAALQDLLDTLLSDASGALVLTVPSNAAAAFNPWSGLAPGSAPDAPPGPNE